MKRAIQVFALAIYTMSLHAQGDKIIFKAEYPEGIAYHNGSFFVSSVKSATIGKVDASGQYQVFYSESALKSSFGMKTDAQRNLLWVCTGDPTYSKYSDSSTYKKMIRLVAIDLTSGNKVKDIDLSRLFEGKHFANDLAIDKAGNIYITDSYSPVIYRVTTDGKASVFSRSDYFKAIDVGLNGIVAHPDGYLLVVNNSQGAIYKVSMESGTTIAKVKINQFFPGADGLLLDNNNNLVLVQNKGVNKIFTIRSTDGFASASVVSATMAEDRFAYPSTATTRNGKIYVMNSKLNELQDPSVKPSEQFIIQEAVFRPSN